MNKPQARGNYYPQSPRRKKGGWTRWLIAIPIFLIVFSAFLGFFSAFLISRFSILEILFTLSPTVQNIPEMNVLLLGVDATEGVKRSDTIMVLHLDPKTKRVGIVSIPRDTLVVIPGVRLDKINHAYAFGGPELACSTTSNFLKVPIPYYIKINVDSLENAIDRMGGITMDVEDRMYYVDYAGGLSVDLKPGVQKLNGKQALGYLRFRHDAQGDFGRIKRQQKFLSAVLAEAARTKNLGQIYGLITDFLGSVETNLTSSQMMGLASTVRTCFETGNIEMTSLPGTSVMIDKVYYLQPEMTQVEQIVNKFLRGMELNEAPKQISQL